MRYRYVLFDFDGTLFDTSEGILKGFRLALESAGIPVGEDRELSKFIGPPVIPALMEFCDMTEAEAQRTKKVYRSYYESEGVFLCRPIEGAEAFLRRLKGQDRVLSVATSKPERFARAILERFGFSKYFDFVAGARPDETRSDKSEVISFVLAEAGVRDLSSAVMIGDRKYDVIGARKAGLSCIGIDTGFSEKGELEEAGAVAVAKNYEELSRLFEGI